MKRIAYVDAMKGLGIILVIAGHLFKYWESISSVIFSFHMPLFFFVSGMFFREDRAKSFKPYIKRKAIHILVPYVCFVLVGFIVTLIVPSWRGMINKNTFAAEFYKAAFESFHVGQLWFLMCLFFTEVYFYFMHKYIFRRRNAIASLFALMALIYLAVNVVKLYPYIRYNRLPFKMDSALMAAVFYAMGYLLRDWLNSDSFVRDNIVILPACAACTLLLSRFNGWSNIAITRYNDTFRFLFFAMSGILLTAFAAKLLSKVTFLLYLGKNSLVIFSLHSFGLYAYTAVLSAIYHTAITNGLNVSIRDSIIGTIVITPAMMGVAYLYNKGKALIQAEIGKLSAVK